MRKENKILVTDWGSIEEIVVIFDDDKNPYIYTHILMETTFIDLKRMKNSLIIRNKPKSM